MLPYSLQVKCLDDLSGMAKHSLLIGACLADIEEVGQLLHVCQLKQPREGPVWSHKEACSVQFKHNFGLYLRPLAEQETADVQKVPLDLLTQPTHKEAAGIDSPHA